MIATLAFVLLSGTASISPMESGDLDQAEAFLSDSFSLIDRDGSGFIEEAEQPPLKTRQVSTDGTDNGPIEADPAAWRTIFDVDEDGKVSREEYIAKLLPGVLERGIPENWKPRGG